MNLLDSLRLRLFGYPMPPTTEADRRYAQELRERIEQSPMAASDNPTESELCWQQFNDRLHELVQREDPRGFLRWDVIRKSMFVGNADYISSELDLLRRQDDWEQRWQPAIEESPIGRPKPYRGYPRSSGNLIHHAAHLARFEQATGVRVDDLGEVVEFGGGYGSMARLFAQLGFRGAYLIYDFPYFSALQHFYLRSLGLQVCVDALECPRAGTQDAHPNTHPKISCLSDLSLLREGVEECEVEGPRLFLATWSLTEAPVAAREPIMQLLPQFDYFLIGYAHQFGEVDNSAYLKEWAAAMGSEYRWSWLSYGELPGNAYLFGQRQGL